MNRRKFIRDASILSLSTAAFACKTLSTGANVPIFLKDYSSLYKDNPREATIQWFKNARFGLFMHYGLYSILGEGEWVQLRHDPPIPVAEYGKLINQFNAKNFDADFITDLALEAGMKYVNLTSKHHDGFCLWPSKQTDFHIMNSPTKRDIVGELAEACDKKGLGFFLYYSLAADWKHPYFYSREAGWNNARPNYDEPQPEYKFEKDEDFKKYIEFAHNQVKEILEYQPLAGIWFDPIMGYYSRPDLFPVDEIYKTIRDTSPHTLISFKQGANGEEDFMAPERHGGAKVGENFEVARKAYEMNKNKPREICNTMQPKLEGVHGGSTWGYNKHYDGKHLNSDQILQLLDEAKELNANLLLNVGPKPNGSFPDEDIKAFQEVGKKMKT